MSATVPTTVLTGAQVREAFLSFFEEKLNHQRRSSASLVPANNPTVLLTPAGMLPFVPIFLGLEPTPTPPRAVSVQKCARVSGKASDLEAVGRTPRHHTFFEMLGNFSFGDYFKADVIPWAWEFVTTVLGLPEERLWVSIYLDDEESFAIWRDQVGVPEERIFRCDEKDNFWGPPGPTGPCGPCSELHYDLYPGRDDMDREDRLLEIWNLVFMEFFKDSEGKLSPLEKKNVDTGMGLERITGILQGAETTFDTDLLQPIVQAVAKVSGHAYKQSSETDVALKIVADHLRFLAFALADGVIPSNEGRGYVARMILRRAVRYGKRFLGFEEPFLNQLLSVVRDEYSSVYPELVKRFAHSQTVLEREETRFLDTLDKGTQQLQALIDALPAGDQLKGPAAFKLYDTYGFPVELTKDILQEQGFTLDEAGFETAMQEQKDRARASQKGKAIVSDQVFAELIQEVGTTEFVGYERLETDSKVVALLVDGEPVASVSGTNQPFQCVLNTTSFYPEGGGQVGDQGRLISLTGQQALTAVVKDTQKFGELIVHDCLFDQGDVLTVGDEVTAEVESVYRDASAMHHSATHLLHAALHKVLGPEAAQAGSYVSPEGARFDFTFPRGLTSDELNRVEVLMNRWIQQATPCDNQLMSMDAAKQAGALAMFDEKYGNQVRVVRFGADSMELCGGTHVEHLGQISVAKILSEGAIASGVRRIEFVVGQAAYRQFKQQDKVVKDLSSIFKAQPHELVLRVEKLQADLKAKEKQIKQLEARAVLGQVDNLLERLDETGIMTAQFNDVPADALSALADALADKAQLAYAFVLGASLEGKVSLVARVHPERVKAGLNAGALVKQAATICGGGGGGKPTAAQAGGRFPDKLTEALSVITAS